MIRPRDGPHSAALYVTDMIIMLTALYVRIADPESAQGKALYESVNWLSARWLLELELPERAPPGSAH